MTPLARVEAALAARWPENKIEPSLDRIAMLMDLHAEPHRTYPVIHVAGTNGKTSTTRMIDALLREHGLRTGRFTSPHLTSILERISIDGQPVSEERFVDAYDEIEPLLGLVDAAHPDTPLSFFEVMTALAFVIFADAPVDVAVVEVGMGGTWDATNVVEGDVAVVMPIGLDHREYLGDTIEEVASEKAGIIKAGSLVIVAAQDPAAAEVVLAYAAEVGATVAVEGVQFGISDRQLAIGGQQLAIRGLGGVYNEVVLPLFGEHQAQNAACALAAVEAFLGAGPLEPELVRAGFLESSSPGRLEVLRRSPTVVVDAAHNPHGARALAAALSESFTFERLVGVIAVLADKDVTGLLDELSAVVDEVVVTTNSSPRAMSAAELGEIAREVLGDERVTIIEELPDAIDAAVTLAEESGLLSGTGVIVTGSVVTVADVRKLFGREGAR